MSKANPKASAKNMLTVDSAVSCGVCLLGLCAALVAKFYWAIDVSEDTLSITSQSTIPDGDSVASQQVYVRQSSEQDWVTDDSGDEPVVIDLTQFDSTKDLQVRLRIVTANGCINYVDTIIPGGWNQGDSEGWGDWEFYPPTNHPPA